MDELFEDYPQLMELGKQADVAIIDALMKIRMKLSIMLSKRFFYESVWSNEAGFDSKTEAIMQFIMNYRYDEPIPEWLYIVFMKKLANEQIKILGPDGEVRLEDFIKIVETIKTYFGGGKHEEKRI